jgi:hypothetical protein
VVSVTTRPSFSPGERTPGTHCTRGWLGPRVGLDTEVRGRIPSPLPGIEPRSLGRPARSQTLYCLSYPVSHADIDLRNFFTPPPPCYSSAEDQNELTPWSRLVLEMLIAPSASEECPAFLEPEGLLPCS